MERPEILPIFALPNVVLFPGMKLPLHIFEPRYREMVADARKGSRMIGMALLKGDWQAEYHARPPIFPVGCAGRLADIDELEDGRFNIVLDGVAVYEIVEDIFDRSYRQARVRWREADREPMDPKVFQSLEAILAQLVPEEVQKSVGAMFERDPQGLAHVVNLACFSLGFDPLEKQGLLEEPTLNARARRLTDALTFYVAQRAAGPKPPTGVVH